MNYSRNIKKASIGKRVLISWVVVAIIFSLVGFGIGAICSGNDSPEQPEPETQKEVLIFGQPDGRIFEGEMPGEWVNGERKFVPLNVPMDEDLQEFIFYLSQAYDTDFTEPYGNVRAGMFILRKLFEKYETPEKVLMAYNMGETGASRLWEQGIFEINYSKSVLQIQQELNAELERSSNND